jgi:EAL domain-containing protein (putative c-di-GMP-specific phosphodiesterase class I)
MSKKSAYYNQITNIVIDNTFKALKDTDKQISLNLSSLDIENIEIRNKLIELISIPENYGRLMFELLEDEVVHDFNQIKEFIEFVKVVGGVTIAIDDFGAGYSNFERILDFQPDILKIDGSLIKNIVTDKFSLNVVETIVTFTKKQNIKITAEFVENEEIFNILKNLGIEFSQGYYFGKPTPL